MPELRTCPFCGGNNVTVEQDTTEICGNRYWRIVHRQHQKKCLLVDVFGIYESSAEFTTQAKAAEAWNKRAGDSE